jgi:acetyl-CoA C-acetyltransferase
MESMGVAVMGVGFCGASPTSTGMSYRELISRAARAAYDDAGIVAEQLDGAVSAEEDFYSGYSIADEYVPDQLGVCRKPVYTIPGDFLHAVGSAAMQIATGRFDMLVVEAYSKASNVLLKDEVLHLAFDPVFGRLGVSPHFLAALEMQRYMEFGGCDLEDVAEVVRRNHKTAIGNPLAPYGSMTTVDDVLAAPSVASPLTEPMIARHADASVVMVLGTDEAAARYARKPVYLTGIGWGSGTSIVERREPGMSAGTKVAAKAAFEEAGIGDPGSEIDVFYVSDLYAHRQLLHMDELGLGGEVAAVLNPDGGALGMGDLLEATGGARMYDAVLQLRGEAGAHQVEDAESAMVHAWRGLPTDSCAVAVLETRRTA